jgi:hypothetical protein
MRKSFRLQGAIIERDFMKEHDNTKAQICEAALIALNLLTLNLRVDVSQVDHHWQVDFYDTEHLLTWVYFERPPNADVQWYTMKILEELKKKLNIN